MKKVTSKRGKGFYFGKRGIPTNKALLAVCFLVLGLLLTVNFAFKQTRFRSKAASGTSLTLATGTTSYSVGDTISIPIVLDPAGDSVSMAKVSITYDSTKLKRLANGLVPDTNVFPLIMEGPVYDQCSGITCSMIVNLGIGSDPTRIVTTAQTIATVNFQALAATDQSGSDISFGQETQILSASPNATASDNVLALANPINITIADITPTITDTPTPLPTDTPTPTPTPSPTPTNTPTSTPTPTPTNTPTPVPSATPTPQPQNAFLNLALNLANPPQNANGSQPAPKHLTRMVNIYLYKPTDNPKDQTVQPLYTPQDTVTYDATSTQFINTHFNLGNIASGSYQMLVKTDGYLRKLLTQYITIQNGQTVTIGRPITLIPGDISPVSSNQTSFGDNIINISDWNLYVSCYGDKANTSSCPNPPTSQDPGIDIDDDGIVDAIDGNYLLKSFSVIPSGQNISQTPIQGSGNTQLAITVCPQGLGNCGDNVNPSGQGNMNPLHTTRHITLSFYDTNNNLSGSPISGTVNFVSSAGNFQGTITVGDLPTGNYSVWITMPQFLTTLVPGIQNIITGRTNTLSPVSLIAGDINADGQVDLADYTILINCYSDVLPPKSCNNQKTIDNIPTADITDDGFANALDYNLFIRELSSHNGD